MASFKKIIKWGLLALPVILLAAGAAWVAAHKNFPVLQHVLSTDAYGDITVSRPLIIYQDLAVVLADTRQFDAKGLAYRIAKSGAAVAVIDTARAVKAMSSGANHCLAPDRVKEPIEILSKWAGASRNKPVILAGIGDGALLPFLSAVTQSGVAIKNLSVGFAIQLPQGVKLCSPLTSAIANGRPVLTGTPHLSGKWLSAWTDSPNDDTGLFVRELKTARTIIAPYNTPLDSVAVNEIQKIITEDNSDPVKSLPLVEVPSPHPNDTVTLFYSGDGGWRDLDRAVAGQMAKLGYPVVGVDMLRYFWSSKTPEQAAADLSAIMAHYRAAWNTKNFVLAGYSFGADLMPAVYNRLPEPDQKNVALLVLLALGDTADFEIHVAGWIGKDHSGVPILPELRRIEEAKVLCVYGREEKDETACTALTSPDAKKIELPGGHHFDYDYPKLTKRIIDIYRQAGLKGNE